MVDTPLWKVMYDSRPPGLTTPDRFWMYERDCYAAELRAIAEAIDDRVAQCLDDDPAEIATWLRKEADRAERGEK